MSYDELIKFAQSKGLSKTEASDFAYDVILHKKDCSNSEDANLLLVSFATAAGIALAIDDDLGGIPGDILAAGAGIALEGLSIFADIFGL
jgi:hypothetical protein